MQSVTLPIALGPVTREAEFYPEPFRVQQIKVLTHLAEFTHLCLVLEGPAGAGKSTLLGRFVAAVPEHWRVCIVSATPALGIDELRGALLGAASIGGDTLGDEELLHHHLAGIRESDLVALLVVDDAEALRDPVLQQVLSWARPTEGALHVLLAGTGLPSKLKNIAHDEAGAPLKLIELPAFSEAQTAEYVMHRMAAAAGHASATVFDDASLRRVHRAAHGLPGLINHELTLHGARPRVATPRQARIVGLALGACVLVAAFVTWWITPPPAPTTAQAPPAIPAVSSGQIARQIPVVPSLIALDKTPAPLTPAVEHSDKAWVLHQPPEHYTLQLASEPAEEQIRALLKKFSLDGESAVVSLRVANGKTQYALLWGSFADRTQAISARNALPKQLRRRQPWMRTFADVHRQLVP
ncbi:MAG: AAA family ATPase [Pseudomonadota bacterium]